VSSLSLQGLRPRAANARARSKRRYWWSDLPDDELLTVPLSELGLEIEGSPLEERLRVLCDDLERAGLRFRPYVWLSTDWFCPDGHTGFAIPFFLASTRLMALERKLLFDVEGGTSNECLRLLRHETGHALDNAYRLRRRRDFRERFGPVSQRYKASYRANPVSRQFVVSLDGWYAQSHPLEDFAETFAVRIGEPRAWRKRYADWAALRKLVYVDELLAEIGETAPALRSTARPESLSRESQTLGEYYVKRRKEYLDEDERADQRLSAVFEARPRRSRRESAAGFLRANRRDLVEAVSNVSRVERYVVDQALREMVRGCRRLSLAADRDDPSTMVRAGALLGVMSHELVTNRSPEFRR
jgi:hypothetical protein